MGRRLDAHLGRSGGGTGVAKRLHAGIEVERYVYTSGLRGKLVDGGMAAAPAVTTNFARCHNDIFLRVTRANPSF